MKEQTKIITNFENISTALQPIKSSGNRITNLIGVGTVIYAGLLNYAFISQTMPVFTKTYNDAITVYKTLKGTMQAYEECYNIPMPDSYIVNMLDKIYEGEYNYTKMYKIVSCVATGRFNLHLKDKPEFLKTNIPEFTERFSDTTSRALMPYGVQSIDNRELVILNGYLDNLDNVLVSLIVYEEGKDIYNPIINIAQTTSNLQHYATMPAEELSRMLKEDTTSFNMFSSIFYSTGADMLSLGNMLIYKVLEVGPVPAVNIIDSYIFMVQDFCKLQIRQIEDFQRQSERNLSDFLTKVYRTIQNMRAFITILKYVFWLNGVTCGFFIYWLALTKRC